MIDEQLAVPLTEIEKAELLRAASDLDRPLNYEGVTRLRRALFEIDRLRALVEAWRPFVQSFANIVKPDAASGHHIVRIVCTTECGVEARAALALEKEADHATN